MIRHIFLGMTAALALMASLSHPAHAAPSFDCKKAASDAEKLICRDPALALLDVDITKAYAAAAIQMDANGKKKLKEDQNDFNRARDLGLAAQDYDLNSQMTMRRDFLRSIREAKGKWLGHWANSYGSIEIRQEKGVYQVHASAAEPIRGSWVCEFDDSAAVAGTTLTVGEASAKLEAGGPNEGWVLALKMTGDVLVLTALKPKGAGRLMPFCGNNGSMDGTYFAQASQRPN